MKVTLESTDKIITLERDGSSMPARIWEGHTENGIAVHAYLTRIAVDKDSDCSQFERELQSHKAPSVAILAIPLRLIL